MPAKILHNPNCSTSRNALAILKASGETPEVIEYLKNPPTETYLTALLERMNFMPRELIRTKEPLYKELGLDDAKITDEQLIAAMVEHPILINRPIVITGKGTVLARPLERVFEILDNPVSEFTKENGDVIYYSKV